MSLDFTPEEENKHKDRVQKWRERKSTDHLLSYTDFSVKEELFGGNLYFTNPFDLFKFIDEDVKQLKKGQNFIFRGVGKASYRMFNKAQRAFMSHQEGSRKNDPAFHAAISEMLKNAQTLDNYLFNEYFASFGVKRNDVAALSFLQHYGAPTPLLDWTYDLQVALFFAIYDLSNEDFDTPRFKDEKIIDEFFSVYLMREDMPLYMMNDYKKLSIHSKNKAAYTTLKRRNVAHISEVFKNGKPVLFLQNNLRIIKQKGIFIYNNSSFQPLEEVIFKKSSIYYLFRSPQDDTVFRTPIICMNIHKSLALLIKTEMAKRGYTKTTMFPDAKRIARIAVPKSLR